MRRTIGVISDTHGLMRPQALNALVGSELILHAGDVGDPAILTALARIAPVHAVCGNTDYGVLRATLPLSTVVDLDAPDGEPGDDPGASEHLALVHHGDQELDLDPAAAGLALVVSGHTHRPSIEWLDGVLHLNPGSAGPRRFSLPVSVARLRVEAGGLSAEIVELDVEERG